MTFDQEEFSELVDKVESAHDKVVDQKDKIASLDKALDILYNNHNIKSSEGKRKITEYEQLLAYAKSLRKESAIKLRKYSLIHAPELTLITRVEDGIQKTWNGKQFEAYRVWVGTSWEDGQVVDLSTTHDFLVGLDQIERGDKGLAKRLGQIKTGFVPILKDLGLWKLTGRDKRYEGQPTNSFAVTDGDDHLTASYIISVIYDINKVVGNIADLERLGINIKFLEDYK